MASLESLINKKIKLLESVPEKLATDAQKVQLKTWKALGPLLSEFEVDSTGNILQSDANVRKIGEVADSLNKLIAGTEYQEAVKSFIDSIDEGVKLTDAIAKKFKASYEPTSAQRALLKLTQTNAIDAFVGTGLRNKVTQPFIEQLTANVAARAPLSKMIQSLQTIVIGDGKNDGKLLEQIKTTAITAQAVSDRSYSAVVSDTLQIEYFKYIGGEIPTSRNFCRHREGEIFHAKEIEAWGDGRNSGGIDDIVDGTWAGRIDGTDSKTIFTFLGGWNCRHYLAPIDASRVPDEVKLRVKSEGYI